MSNEKRPSVLDYIRGGHFAYGVRLGDLVRRQANNLTAEPERGLATHKELLDYLDKNGINYYRSRNTDEDEYDSVGQDIDGCLVDLETEEWLELFQESRDGRPETPMTLAYIPNFDIELGAGTSDEDLAILKDLLIFVAEFRLVKGLEPGQSLDEAIV